MGQGQTKNVLEKNFQNIISDFSDKDRDQLLTLKQELGKKKKKKNFFF